MLDQYFGDYITVAAFVAMGAIVVGGSVLASSLIRPNKPTKVKSETYECGIDPIGDARLRFSMKFFIIAIIFLVFDIEVIFLYPWAVLFRKLGLFGLIEMGIFIVILIIGLFYVWKRGALEWE